MRKLIFAALVLLIAVTLNPGVALAALPPPVIVEVHSGESIQNAINVAPSGATIVVHAGTYTEKLVINGKSLTLRSGLREEVTIQNPLGTDGRVIQVSNATDVTIQGFTVDGTGYTGRLDVIYYNNASGKILRNKVISGTSGIYALATSGGTCNVAIEGNTVRGYQRNGITVNEYFTQGTAVARIIGNTAVGSGPNNQVAQNGIQLGYGATGVITGNIVKSNWFTGTAYQAAGILNFAGSNTKVGLNYAEKNQVNIYLSGDLWWGTGPAESNDVAANVTKGGDTGILIAYNANNNKVGLNDITDSARAGIDIFQGSRNTVNRNIIKKNKIGVWIEEPASVGNAITYNYFYDNEIVDIKDMGTGTVITGKGTVDKVDPPVMDLIPQPYM